MTLIWKKCPMCNGFGEITIMKSRVYRLKDKEPNPLLKDNTEKCPNCNGKGNLYVKQNPFLNPFNPFRKDEDE